MNQHRKYNDVGKIQLSNLSLWSTAQPAGQEVSDKIAWAIDILNKYGSAEHYNDFCDY